MVKSRTNSLRRAAVALERIADVMEAGRAYMNKADEDLKKMGAVFDPDDPTYDPEDDTFATGKECPNCGNAHITKHDDGGCVGMQIHFHCNACHHIWPYVMAKDRP